MANPDEEGSSASLTYLGRGENFRLVTAEPSGHGSEGGWGMKRGAIVVVVLSAALVMLPAVPGLAKPPNVGSGQIAAGDACSFAVDYVTQDRIRSKMIFDRDGNPVRFEVTGSQTVELSNPLSGKSMTLQISGPEQDTFQSDGSVLVKGTGPWLLWGAPLFGPGLFFTQGQFVVRYDDQGGTVVKAPARATDVCPQLA